MRIKKNFVWCVFLLYSLIMTISGIAWPENSTKLAIVDVGIQQKVPGLFLDLLTASFSKYPEVAQIGRASCRERVCTTV